MNTFRLDLAERCANHVHLNTDRGVVKRMYVSSSRVPPVNPLGIQYIILPFFHGCNRAHISSVIRRVTEKHCGRLNVPQLMIAWSLGGVHAIDHFRASIRFN